MAPPEGSYAGRRIRSDLFEHLELRFGERVVGACDTDALRLGILESPASDRVILVDTTGDVIDSFEWFYDALEAVGRMLDAHLDSVPTDVAGEPSPTLVIPRDRSLEVVYRTADGLRSAEELFEHPGRLIDTGVDWPNFTEATLTLALEG